MKVAKLVFGILSIIFSVLVLFQSCAASVVDAVQGTSAGTTGMIVGVLMLASGIVKIATRNNKGGTIACIIMYGLAGLIGLTMHDYYEDLQVWGAFSLIVCAVNVISLFTQFKETTNSVSHEEKRDE